MFVDEEVFKDETSECDGGAARDENGEEGFEKMTVKVSMCVIREARVGCGCVKR